MDNALDESIIFNEKGECNYCTEALSKIGTTTYFPNQEGQAKINSMVKLLKEEGKNKDSIALWAFLEVWTHHISHI